MTSKFSPFNFNVSFIRRNFPALSSMYFSGKSPLTRLYSGKKWLSLQKTRLPSLNIYCCSPFWINRLKLKKPDSLNLIFRLLLAKCLADMADSKCCFVVLAKEVLLNWSERKSKKNPADIRNASPKTSRSLFTME